MALRQKREKKVAETCNHYVYGRYYSHTNTKAERRRNNETLKEGQVDSSARIHEIRSQYETRLMRGHNDQKGHRRKIKSAVPGN